MRPLVVLLLVFAVVACPYHCAARPTDSWVDSHGAAMQIDGSQSWETSGNGCCAFCQTREPSPSHHNEPPPSPAQERHGRSCFCEGVLFDLGTRSPSEHTYSKTQTYSASAWTTLFMSAEQLQLVDRTLKADDIPSPPPLAGRTGRIAIRSLLL